MGNLSDGARTPNWIRRTKSQPAPGTASKMLPVSVPRNVSVSNLAQHVRRIRLRHSTGRSYDSHKCTGQQRRRRQADRERIVRTYPRKQGGGYTAADKSRRQPDDEPNDHRPQAVLNE